MVTTTHTVMGGKVHLYKRGNGDHWHCYTFLKGKKYRKSTKEDSLSLAKEIADDWYITLRGKERAGVLKSGKSFAQAAEQFLKEYAIITEGQRSERWIEGYGIRLRLHILPFFDDLKLTEITAGKVQEYRVHRAQQKRVLTGQKPEDAKPPARSTIHDEIVTIRQVLKTALRHGWLTHLPDLSPPYKTQGKVVHRPWFSPAEYKTLYEATRA